MTTAPAPTTVSSPIVTPGQTIAPPPSQTLSPIVIGSADSQPCRRGSGSIGCVAVRSCTFVASWQASPIRIGAGVEHDAVEVDERPCADRDLGAVVAPERRADDHSLAELPEELAQDRVAALLIGVRRGVEALEHRLRAGVVGPELVVDAVELAAEHPLFHLRHQSCAAAARSTIARVVPRVARARLPGVWCDGSPASVARDRVGLVLAGHEEEELVRVAEARQRQRDPVDERLVAGLGADDVAVGHVERREVREERGDVPVGAEAEQDEVERADVAAISRS